MGPWTPQGRFNLRKVRVKTMKLIFEKLNRYFYRKWHLAVLNMDEGLWVIKPKALNIPYLKAENAKGRHILLQPDNTMDASQLTQLADSLQDALANGADFTSNALLYSKDGSAQMGGDLGWFPEGQMVKPFSDSCFYGEVGKIMQVPTQFGIHLIEVLEKSRNVKKVKVAYLSRNVEPSSETYQNVYSEAVRFAGINNTYEKFNTAIADQNLTKRYANDLTPSQKTITGLDQPRALIRCVPVGGLARSSTAVSSNPCAFTVMVMVPVGVSQAVRLSLP